VNVGPSRKLSKRDRGAFELDPRRGFVRDEPLVPDVAALNAPAVFTHESFAARGWPISPVVPVKVLRVADRKSVCPGELGAVSRSTLQRTRATRRASFSERGDVGRARSPSRGRPEACRPRPSAPSKVPPGFLAQGDELAAAGNVSSWRNRVGPVFRATHGYVGAKNPPRERRGQDRIPRYARIVRPPMRAKDDREKPPPGPAASKPMRSRQRSVDELSCHRGRRLRSIHSSLGQSTNRPPAIPAMGSGGAVGTFEPDPALFMAEAPDSIQARCAKFDGCRAPRRRSSGLCRPRAKDHELSRVNAASTSQRRTASTRRQGDRCLPPRRAPRAVSKLSWNVLCPGLRRRVLDAGTSLKSVDQSEYACAPVRRRLRAPR